MDTVVKPRNRVALEKQTAGSLLTLLIYTAWAGSGIYGGWHAPLWVLFAVFTFFFVWLAIKKNHSQKTALWKTPLFLTGLVLVALLFIQWVNTGGILFKNMFTGKYSFTPPAIPWLPFSVDASLSRQQLAWFAPAWIMALAVRYLFSRATIKWLLWAMVWNAAALASFGLIQYGLGIEKLFGLVELPGNPHIIATFEYPNHGGTFFYLFYALAIGLLMDAIEKHKPALKMALPAGLGLLFAVASLASLSRAAVLAIAGITLAGILVWVVRHHRSFTPASWLNLTILGGVMSVMFILGLVSIGNGAVLKEFTTDASSEQQTMASYYDENRGFQIPPALAMTRDYPWFGVGGWGYRSFLRAYLPDAEFQRYLSTGRANVHCDPVQFLAEHGCVGFGLMSIGLACVAFPWRAMKQWPFKGIGLMTLCGCGVVLLHSLIDLPFRCPTVLWQWILLLAMVPVFSQRVQRAIQHGCVDEFVTHT